MRLRGRGHGGVLFLELLVLPGEEDELLGTGGELTLEEGRV